MGRAKLPKKKLRSFLLRIPVNAGEKADIEAAAAVEGIAHTVWCRSVIHKAAREIREAEERRKIREN